MPTVSFRPEWNDVSNCWEIWRWEDGELRRSAYVPLDDLFVRVKEIKRKRDNFARMECIAEIPIEFVNELANRGYPVMDPEFGDEVLMEAVRREFPAMCAVADKGNAAIHRTMSLPK